MHYEEYILKKHFFKKGKVFGSWKLIRFLNSGGNGEVWIVENQENEKAAIKILKKIKQKAYFRFCDECKTVVNNSDITGVLPIIDLYLPSNFSKETPWYVMPIATPLSEYLKEKNAPEIIQSISYIAEILEQLHCRDIYHRDIKPANLFYNDGNYFIGDFGLVDYPDKKDLTMKGETVGPKWTMAPEMKRNAEKASGGPADVYSLAKTMWILLTKESKGFEGQYIDDTFIGLQKFQPSIFREPLNELLSRCTENDSKKRPSAKEVSKCLKNWIPVNKNYEQRNKLEWFSIQKKLFPSSIPLRVFWKSVDDILSILKITCSSRSLNHMFFPNGGGLDLTGIQKSVESDCLELDFGGSIYIVKPNNLIFESFGDDTEWNYFRLETGNLEPMNPEKVYKGREVLAEIEPGIYTDYECLEYDDFNGESLPSSARGITRVIHGDFVIFQKTSLYNKNPRTYDGRHNKLTADQFRDHISLVIEHLNKNKPAGRDISRTKIKYIKPKIYRKNERILSKKEIELLKQIILMAKSRNDENDNLRKKYGLSDYLKFPPDAKEAKYYNAPKPIASELNNFLTNLSQDEIELVAAVMYGGRDYLSHNRTTALHEMLGDFKNDSDLVYSIYEKSPLADYLEAGIKAYSTELGHVTYQANSADTKSRAAD